VCGSGYDTLHILQCQFSLDYSLTESSVGCPKALDSLFQVVLGYLPHLPSRIGEMMVDGLDHKHTAEDVGHSAVPDYRVVADSGDALNLQPCAVTVEKMDNLHVKRFLHQMVGSLWHDFGLCCGQQNGALLR
jgi:hypothetical protein